MDTAGSRCGIEVRAPGIGLLLHYIAYLLRNRHAIFHAASRGLHLIGADLGVVKESTVILSKVLGSKSRQYK